MVFESLETDCLLSSLRFEILGSKIRQSAPEKQVLDGDKPSR